MKKPLHIWFDKVDGFVKVYDGARSLVLFSPERYDAIYDRVKYFISRKSGITYSTDHNFARMKFDSNNFLPIEKKTMAFNNFIIFFKSVFNNNQITSTIIYP